MRYELNIQSEPFETDWEFDEASESFDTEWADLEWEEEAARRRRPPSASSCTPCQTQETDSIYQAPDQEPTWTTHTSSAAYPPAWARYIPNHCFAAYLGRGTPAAQTASANGRRASGRRASGCLTGPGGRATDPAQCRAAQCRAVRTGKRACPLGAGLA